MRTLLVPRFSYLDCTMPCSSSFRSESVTMRDRRHVEYLTTEPC